LDNANKAYIAEIEDFKLQSIQKTEENNKAMMEFKERIKNEKQDAKNEYNQKINELEKKNTDLKKRIADYQENGKDNWESFKKEFNHDMDELGNAFSNLTKKNTK
jgi:phage host-nuclease inhibitor protein Gam